MIIQDTLIFSLLPKLFYLILALFLHLASTYIFELVTVRLICEALIYLWLKTINTSVALL